MVIVVGVSATSTEVSAVVSCGSVVTVPVLGVVVGVPAIVVGVTEVVVAFSADIVGV